MENYSLSISSVLNTAWEYAKKYGLLIAVIYLLTDLLASVGGHACRRFGKLLGSYLQL